VKQIGDYVWSSFNNYYRSEEDSDFVDEEIKRYNRREKQVGIHGKRIDDRYIEPVEKVIWAFERLRG
jgi:hypothetical protein